MLSASIAADRRSGGACSVSASGSRSAMVNVAASRSSSRYTAFALIVRQRSPSSYAAASGFPVRSSACWLSANTREPEPAAGSGGRDVVVEAERVRRVELALDRLQSGEAVGSVLGLEGCSGQLGGVVEVAAAER